MGEKYKRYVEAYRRIDSSIASAHYFEAIAIEESIISDRIASFMEATGALKSEHIHRQSFSSLISLWQLSTRIQGSIWERCDALVERVNTWRTQRNKYIHGLVKFPVDMKNVPSTEDFLTGAKETANSGKYLAISVSEWRARQVQVKRRYNKSLNSTPVFSSSSDRVGDAILD